MVFLKKGSPIRKAAVFAISLGAAVFGTLGSAQAQMCPPSTPPDQCRNCSLTGQPSFFFPGDPGPEVRQLGSVIYQETGPFLSTPSAPSSLSVPIGLMSPPVSSTAPMGTQLLAAAMLETMGYCEGPLTFSKAGDSGTATTNFGPCGTLTDSFVVVGDGSTGSGDYQIQHTLSGSLTLSNLTGFGAEIDRSGSITLGASSASGQVQISSGGTPLCTGTFTATYPTPHSNVAFPWPCLINSRWTGYGPASGIASGSVVRQPTPMAFGPFTITPTSGPVAGGTHTSICGTGACSATSVTFGGLAATSLGCGSVATCPGPDFPLLAVTPAHAAGPVNVVVSNASSTSTIVNGYTYGAPAAPALPATWGALGLAGILGLAGWLAIRRSAYGQA